MINTNKRSVIDPERLTTLKQPNAVYTITCFNDEYFCANHDEGCWRGFFSLYLQVIHSIVFARRMDLPYHVDFGNLLYRYSEEKNFMGDRNFWNYYFEQEPIRHSSVQIINFLGRHLDEFSSPGLVMLHAVRMIRDFPYLYRNTEQQPE